MTANCRVLIADAESIAKRLDQQAVVILGVERDGTVTIVTYGETKWKCRVIGDWAKGLRKQAISVCPFQTAFGWGNNGKPKRLPTVDLLMLGSAGAGYVEHNTAKDAESA
jgi:hypothetical protein